MKRFQLILSFMLVIFCVWTSTSQKVETNDNGDRIIKYSDGSWRYYEPADSFLLKNNKVQEHFFQTDDNNVSPFEDPDKKFKDLPPSNVSSKVSQLIKSLEDKNNLAIKELEDASAKRRGYDDTLDRMYGNIDNEDDANVKKMERGLKTAKDDEKLLKKAEKNSRQQLDQARKIALMEGKKQERAYQGFLEQIQGESSIVIADDQVKRDKIKKDDKNQSKKSVDPSKETNQRKSSPNRNPSSEKSPQIVNVMMNPPSFVCNTNVTEDKEFEGGTRVDTKPELFFDHTPEDMRPYIKDEEFIRAFGNVTSLSGFTYLNLKFIIASKQAKTMFGGIEPNGLLQIKLISGETIRLFNSVYDSPQVEPVSGNIIFQGHYIVDKTESKQLRKYEIDKIRVVWSTGYEDYTIYNVDFLKNHLNCLNK